MLNDTRNDKQVLISHRLFIVDDKKRNQLDKKMNCSKGNVLADCSVDDH